MMSGEAQCQYLMQRLDSSGNSRESSTQYWQPTRATHARRFASTLSSPNSASAAPQLGV
eukprot:COSAG06_NODE_11170_length_1552_cov_1.807295_2_plen_59_part_00